MKYRLWLDSSKKSKNPSASYFVRRSFSSKSNRSKGTPILSKKKGIPLSQQKNERCTLKDLMNPNQTILDQEVTRNGGIKVTRCYSYDQLETCSDKRNRPAMISPERRQDKSTFLKMNTSIHTSFSDHESERKIIPKNESKVLNKKLSLNGSIEMQPTFSKVFQKLDLSDEFPCEKSETLVSTSETIQSTKSEVANSDWEKTQINTQNGSLLDLDDSGSESECRDSVHRLSIVGPPNDKYENGKTADVNECKSPTQFVYVDHSSNESLSGLQDVDSWVMFGNEKHESSVLFGTNHLLENVLQCLKSPFICTDYDSIDTDYYNSLRETYFHDTWSFSDEATNDSFYRNEDWSYPWHSHENGSVMDTERSVEVTLNEDPTSSKPKIRFDLFDESIDTSFSFDFSDRT